MSTRIAIVALLPLLAACVALPPPQRPTPTAAYSSAADHYLSARATATADALAPVATATPAPAPTLPPAPTPTAPAAVAPAGFVYRTPTPTGDPELDGALDGWRRLLAETWGSPLQLTKARAYWDAHPELSRSRPALMQLLAMEEAARRR